MKEVEEGYFAMSRPPLLLAARSLVMKPTMLVEVSTLGPHQALSFTIVFSLIILLNLVEVVICEISQPP